MYNPVKILILIARKKKSASQERILNMQIMLMRFKCFQAR